MEIISTIITVANKISINTVVSFFCILVIGIFYFISFVYADNKIKELDKEDLENKIKNNDTSLFYIFGDSVSSQEEIDNTASRLIKYLEKKSVIVKRANNIAKISIILMIVFAFVYTFVSVAFNEFTGATGNDFVGLIVMTFIGMYAPDSILGLTGKKKPFEDFNGELEISSAIDQFDEFNETDISAEEARRIMSNDVAKNYIQRVVKTGRKLTNMEFGILMTHVDNAEAIADIEAVEEIIYGKEFKQRNV